MRNSIFIILKQFKENHLTEEETVKLIEDLYGNKITYVPWYIQTTLDNTPIIPKYEYY